jgi:hypothetical protein
MILHNAFELRKSVADQPVQSLPLRASWPRMKACTSASDWSPGGGNHLEAEVPDVLFVSRQDACWKVIPNVSALVAAPARAQK